MTRDQLELVCAREGLTRPQREAVLAAAEAYATAQCRAAIDALAAAQPVAVCGCGAALWPGRTHACGGDPPETVTGWVPGDMHWQVHVPWSGPACDPASGKPCTTDRGRVTCGACRQTPAWKKAA